MKAVIFASRARKRVRRPCESMATPGQKVSSKTKNTLRRAMITLRRAKAQVRTTSTTHVSGRRSRGRASARKLNEDLLELGLAHLAIPHQHALLVQPAEDLGQALVEGVHRVLHELTAGVALQHAGQAGQALRRHRVETERDHVPDADLALQLVGGALSQDAPILDEGDLVAERPRLAHDVMAEDGRRARVGEEQRGQNGQERGLPRPVGSEQAEDCPAWNLQARAPEGLLAPAAQPSAPEGFRKVFRVDGEHGPLILPRGFGGRPRRALNRLKPSGRTDAWSLLWK